MFYVKSIHTLLYIISFKDLLLTLSSRSFFTSLCMSSNNSCCRNLSFSFAGWCMVLFLSFPESLVLKKQELIQWSIVGLVGGHKPSSPLHILCVQAGQARLGLHHIKIWSGCFPVSGALQVFTFRF